MCVRGARGGGECMYVCGGWGGGEELQVILVIFQGMLKWQALPEDVMEIKFPQTIQVQYVYALADRNLYHHNRKSSSFLK